MAPDAATLPAVQTVIQENTPLAPLTTLGVGGPARYFTRVSTEAQLGEVIDFARARSLAILVLGGGSNLVVSDRGFSGLACRLELERVDREDDGGRAVVRAGAGVDWDTLVADCVSRSLYGVECLSGIPGRVGATPVQNVGAYGQEVSELIRSVRVCDLLSGEMRELTRNECEFRYRTSLFNGRARGRYVVLEVEYAFDRQGEPRLSYPDLQAFFASRGDSPGLVEVREAVLEIRRRKAMLLVEGDPDSRSAGSFFRNPVLEPDEVGQIRQEAERAGIRERVPEFPSGEGVKVPAAWLIEHAGFARGTSDGAVGLSAKHALALINRGGATAADIVGFAGRIQDAVQDRFGVRLVTEPAFVGFHPRTIERFGAVTGESPAF